MKALLIALFLAAATAGPAGAAPVVQSSADAKIDHDIKARLAKSKISADHFTVTVQNGVATLEGKTGVIQHKGVATRLAKSGGARLVQNHIQVSDEARAAAAAKLARAASGTAKNAPVPHATVVPAVVPK